MTITVHLPDELAAAPRPQLRGLVVGQVAAQLVAEGLAGQGAADPLQAILTAGASGRRKPLDIRQARRHLAARTTVNDS